MPIDRTRKKKEVKSETLYQKIGDEYVPVAEYSDRRLDSYQHGFYLVHSKDGCVSTMPLFDIEEVEKEMGRIFMRAVSKVTVDEIIEYMLMRNKQYDGTKYGPSMHDFADEISKRIIDRYGGTDE